MMNVSSKVISNLKYVIGEAMHYDPALLIFHLISAVCEVMLPLLSSSAVALIVRCGASPYEFDRLIGCFLLVSAASLLLGVVKQCSAEQIDRRDFSLRTRLQLKYMHRYMTVDYSHLESPEGIDLTKRAVAGWSSGVGGMLGCIFSLATVVIGIFSYGAILSFLHPMFVAVITLVTLGNFYLMQYLNRKEYADKDDYTRLDRRLDYLCSACKDFSAGKDIRLFRLMGFFTKQIDALIGNRLYIDLRRQKRVFAVQILSDVLTLIQSSVFYGYLIVLIFRGSIDASQFVYYFSLLTAFTGWIVTVIRQYSALSSHSYNVTDLRNFFELEPIFGGEKTAPVSAPCITAEHLSFSYDGGKKVLDDLCFSIGRGERIALVGLNGAGKTTLVKLLCGLYTPRGGKLLIDGVPVNEYDKEELVRMYSVVFQDIYLLPVSIVENILLGQSLNRERLDRVMRLSGMDEVCSHLPDGENTLLVKELSEQAIELSGGQKQKLALARALYKDGSVVILDEPTAALDPMAEDEVYRQYDCMTRGKTAVFISHRLASTQFCDRIYLLENGRIAECGTHDELLSEGGRYAELYNIQSKYYKQEAEK